MKPHAVVCFYPNSVGEQLACANVPHWSNATQNKRGTDTPLPSEMNEILQSFGQSVWVTAEFDKAKPTGWSSTEVDCQMNLMYRLISQDGRAFNDDLISSLQQLPYTRYVSAAPLVTTGLGVHNWSGGNENSSWFRCDGRAWLMLDQAQLLTVGRPDVLIAVLDTGVWQQHPELRPVLLSGFDFVDILDGAQDFIEDCLDADPDPQDGVGHGTHIAGIIAGQGIRMPRGVAPDCRILPVRVLGTALKDGRRIGAGMVDNINNGIKWAVDCGADVLNMSLGIKESAGGLPHETAIRYARQKGVTVVAATGNDGMDGQYYPSALQGVIAVGAADSDGLAASFSTTGQHVSLLGPGTNILSSYLNDRYAYSSGTSQAAGFVSGAIGLLKSLGRARGQLVSDASIQDILARSSDRQGPRFRDRVAGYGRLNVRDALRLLEFEVLGPRSGARQRSHFAA